MRTMAGSRHLVIVDDLNTLRALRRPSEADSELPVDPNTVLPAPISLESLQLVAGRHTKRLKRDGGVEFVEFASRNSPEGVRTTRSRGARIDAIEDVLGAPIAKRANHAKPRRGRMGGI